MGFELLNEALIQQAVFELIDGASCLGSKGFEAHSDQEGTRYMIALDARFATLTASRAHLQSHNQSRIAPIITMPK